MKEYNKHNKIIKNKIKFLPSKIQQSKGRHLREVGKEGKGKSQSNQPSKDK